MLKKQILWTACVTPFNNFEKNVDYESLEKCLKLQEKAKNGILLLGSTGESLSLSNEEKIKIVKFACNLKLKSEIIIGVPNYNLQIALEWIDFCNKMPINGYLIATPMYTKPGIIGQTNWFKTLLNKSKYPVMLYNIPGRTCIDLHKQTIKNLKDHKNFIAIKESTGSIENMIIYKEIAKNIKIFCGDDYMMPYMAMEGGIGLISVASNAWPFETRKYVEYSLENKKICSNIWWNACKELFIASNPIPIKKLMYEINLIKNYTVRLPLDTKDLKKTNKIMEYNKIIKDWYIKNES